jgi:hypothetical protein
MSATVHGRSGLATQFMSVTSCGILFVSTSWECITKAHATRACAACSRPCDGVRDLLWPGEPSGRASAALATATEVTPPVLGGADRRGRGLPKVCLWAAFCQGYQGGGVSQST